MDYYFSNIEKVEKQPVAIKGSKGGLYSMTSNKERGSTLRSKEVYFRAFLHSRYF